MSESYWRVSLRVTSRSEGDGCELEGESGKGMVLGMLVLAEQNGEWEASMSVGCLPRVVCSRRAEEQYVCLIPSKITALFRITFLVCGYGAIGKPLDSSFFLALL